jgi:hypothetical protein
VVVVTHFTNLVTAFFRPSDQRLIGENPFRRMRATHSHHTPDRAMLDFSASEHEKEMTQFITEGSFRSVIAVWDSDAESSDSDSDDVNDSHE